MSGQACKYLTQKEVAGGVEGRPKTKRSVRDIRMLPPVAEALEGQSKQTKGKSDYVFLNQYGRPLLPDSMNLHVWKPALEKAGLKYRSLLQTRHTFATLMLDAGELPGWVQQMMGGPSWRRCMVLPWRRVKNDRHRIRGFGKGTTKYNKKENGNR